MENAVEELIQLAKVLEIEYQADSDQHQAFIQNATLQERIHKGFTWQPLLIVDEGYGIGDYPFLVVERTRQKGASHRFSSGSQVSVYAPNASDEKPIEGIIQFIDRDKMKIIFHLDDLPYWIHKESLGVDLMFDERTFTEMKKVLAFLIAEERTDLAILRDKILGYQALDKLSDQHKFDIPQLNESQNRAVQLMTGASDVAAIHGPPGTGKTTTIVEGVVQLSKNGKQLLVCAPSNAATDLLAKRIAEKEIRVLRIGNVARMDEGVIEHTVEHQLSNHPRYKEIKKAKQQAAELRRMAQKYKRNFGREEREQRKLLFTEAKNMARDAVDLEDYLIDELMESAQVICTTLVGSANRRLSNRRFATVIIDEAAQGLEPATWIPITKAQKVIFAGDPLQLPPTIKSKEAAEKGLNNTLIEKVITRLPNTELLDTQYRMHKAIMGFSNAEFYAGQLKADESVADHLLDIASNAPVQFVDTAGCAFDEERDPESLSLMNKGESDILIKHLNILIEELGEESIGVISPYRAQVKNLEELIASDENLKQVEVNTIDSFQGQERDVIYISMVRSNEENQLGFLTDYRRMNVAMTRARKKLVIIGDSATLGSSPFYQRFLDYVETQDAYSTAWEFMY